MQVCPPIVLGLEVSLQGTWDVPGPGSGSPLALTVATSAVLLVCVLQLSWNLNRVGSSRGLGESSLCSDS